MLNLQQLNEAVDSAAALRRRRTLQPAGGRGDKIFPPTYPGEGRNAQPRHVFETRRLDGQNVICVLNDSVQSQANRLEEALLLSALSAGLRGWDKRGTMPEYLIGVAARCACSARAVESLMRLRRCRRGRRLLSRTQYRNAAYASKRPGIFAGESRAVDRSA